jgi:2-methylcitrate dehydratase PrpD
LNKQYSAPQALTAQIARFIRTLTYTDIPQRIREPLGHSIVDTIGCGLLGATTPYSRLVTDYVRDWKSAGEATVWGTRTKASAPFAAMANSAACHAWDYDDTTLPGILHPGSVAVPTAFAVAERNGARVHGRDVITAMAAGYEVGNLVATALGAKRFAADGFYVSVPTIFVAVTTAAKLMKLKEEQLMRALGLAATQAAGLYSATLAKRFNSPKAVLGGIFAADLAKRGLEASHDAIEAGYSGLLGTFARTPEPEVIPRDLGQFQFEIYHKFYPCIRSNHPTVDNVRLMLEEHPDIRAVNVKKIVSHVDQLTIDYTLKTTAGGAEGVKTVGNALISLPYCAAAMVIDRELTLREFTSAKVRRPAVQALMKKIELVADPAIDKLPATQRYRCRTEIHLDDGRVIERSLAGPKGDPNNRLTRDEMYSKFLANASRVIPKERAARLFDALSELSRARDIMPVIKLMKGTQ